MNVADDINNAYNDGYQQGRDDTIDEFVKLIKENHYMLSDRINSTDYGMFTIGLEEIAEHMKEQK